MSNYEHLYSRENSLVALQIWDVHQTEPLKELYGKTYPPFIWDVHEGVASVYMQEDSFAMPEIELIRRAQEPTFISNWLRRYEQMLKPLEEAWSANVPLQTREELVRFCDQVMHAWVGLEVTYFAPMLPQGTITEQERKEALRLRAKAVAFLDDSDRIIVATLKQLYPALGDLVFYIGLNELRSEAIPSIEILKARSRHFLLFRGEIRADMSLEDLLSEQGITIFKEKPESQTTLKGQVAMQGKVSGRARVIKKKSEIPTLLDGEILVTAMTVPDYLPAMKKAAGFVTDEGGITCHAAIVARELGKPCVIGTKFATQLIQTGDLLEVDAERGIVTIQPTLE